MLPKLTLPSDPTKTITRGDTWPGVSFVMKEGVTPINITGCDIRITLICKEVHWVLSTTDGITITDGAGGALKFDAIQQLDQKPGVYTGDLEVTYPDGTITTYIQIEITITDDITK